MNTQALPRTSAPLTLHEWVAAMPIVVLVRAVVSAFGDREPGVARGAAAQIA